MHERGRREGQAGLAQGDRRQRAPGPDRLHGRRGALAAVVDADRARDEGAAGRRQHAPAPRDRQAEGRGGPRRHPRGEPVPRHALRPHGRADDPAAGQGRQARRAVGLLPAARLRRRVHGHARHRAVVGLPELARAQRPVRPARRHRVGGDAAVVQRARRDDRALLRRLDADHRDDRQSEGARHDRAERGPAGDVRPPVAARRALQRPVPRADRGLPAARLAARAAVQDRPAQRDGHDRRALRQGPAGNRLRPAGHVAVKRRAARGRQHAVAPAARREQGRRQVGRHRVRHPWRERPSSADREPALAV